MIEISTEEFFESNCNRPWQYNRLAQRDFRKLSDAFASSSYLTPTGRRRKEHLKSLEDAQREQNSEQSVVIQRLRLENDDLRRENEALRSQIYGPSSAQHGFGIGHQPSYSISPSVSGTPISAAGSPHSPMASSEMMPMASLSLTNSMGHPALHAYGDPSTPSSQPYSIIHHSGVFLDAQSS